MYVCMCVYLCVCVCVCVRAYVCVRVHIRIHNYLPVLFHVCMHIKICKRADTKPYSRCKRPSTVQYCFTFGYNHVEFTPNKSLSEFGFGDN
jgi:hypothetical protein